VEGGRRRIALIDGPADTVPGRSRYLGYLDGLKAAGLEERQELVAFTDFAVGAGAKATQRLLTEGAPDAIFAANDVLAMGALQTLRQQGLSVPDDIAVVGMDDTELAATAWPPLSSVSLGSRERGQLAAELLLKRLEDPVRPPEWIDVEPQLVVRASSTPVSTP
jgi:LacI family transcriptional regulator